MLLLLDKAGYLTTKGGRTHLSPKGVRKMGQLALRDIYQGLLRDRPGGHQADHRGIHDVRPDATRPYQYGDPLHLDLVGTLKKALARKSGTPLELRPDDFEVYDTNFATSTSTVLLLDMSWSMSWEGRFAAAKKVAMAMESLIRARYPRDYFSIVGFFTRAVELKVKDLPEASWNMGDPFTNLQDGLRLATELLGKHPSNNQHIIVITDGQPTAYFSRGRLYCEWPLSFGGISMRAAQETLKEVEKVTRKGITINTFMLDDSASLRAFVERMTRINKGRALYTRPDHLGEYLLVDYIGKKRKKV
ncbi:MAG: VWA domain-containing protein [Gaiellaceae bacterium]